MTYRARNYGLIRHDYREENALQCFDMTFCYCTIYGYIVTLMFDDDMHHLKPTLLRILLTFTLKCTSQEDPNASAAAVALSCD